MTPNQTIAIVIAAASAIYWVYTQATTPDTPAVKTTKLPSAKKLSALASSVKEILDACPYADWALQKQYLLSGESVTGIIHKEMTRLGEQQKPREQEAVDESI
jgi:hypothetical protein